MREVLELLISQLWIVLHHRWIALVSALIICIAGWLLINKIPDQYQVEAKFFFDTKTVLRPLLAGIAVDSPVKQEAISLIRKTLTSRPNLLRVAQETELDLTATTPRELDQLLIKLGNSIRINALSISSDRKSRDNIYNISIVHTNPELAKKIVESLLNIFVESLLGISRKDSDKAEQFLDEKIEEYQLKLEEAEEKIKIFKQKNIGLTPDKGMDYYTRLYMFESKLDDALLRLREENNKNDSLQKQIYALENQTEDTGQEFLVPPPKEKSQLELRIDTLKLKLDNLQLQFTEKHPDVITTKSALEELQKQQETEEQEETAVETDQAGAAEKKSKSIRESDFYQELNIMLSSSNSEIAAINARIDEYRNKIEELKALVNIVPEVEAKMKSLVRNYEILKDTYHSLVQRRASAQISREAEQTGGEYQYNVIEPPRVPLTPVSPNRLMLASMVLLIGVIGGAVLAWVYEQLKPAYYQQQELLDDFEIPVYGSVSMFWSPSEISRRKAGITVFILLYIVLFSGYITILVYYGIMEKIPESVRGALGL